MNKKLILVLLAVAIGWTESHSQTVNPQAYYTDEDNTDQETREIKDGQAPLAVTFRSNPSDMDDYTPSYEWHFRRLQEGEGQRELFVRYEEDTQFTFVESGTYNIVQKTRLEQDGLELDSVTIIITISDSKLVFPNAFSPNDDGTNDKYGAKGVNDAKSPDHYKNIIEFHAYIFNRWGQKLYEWHDPAGWWDGKHNGHDVKEGVYYLLCKAKGADGKEYNIRTDVNLLRGYSSESSSGGNK